MHKNPIYITWIIKEINRYRRYSLYIQPTLFGTYELIRSWGRIGRKMRSMVKAYPTLEEAEREMIRILRQKKMKGYKEIKGY